jgi:hypothetical protein
MLTNCRSSSQPIVGKRMAKAEKEKKKPTLRDSTTALPVSPAFRFTCRFYLFFFFNGWTTREKKKDKRERQKNKNLYLLTNASEGNPPPRSATVVSPHLLFRPSPLPSQQPPIKVLCDTIGTPSRCHFRTICNGGKQRKEKEKK